MWKRYTWHHHSYQCCLILCQPIVVMHRLLPNLVWSITSYFAWLQFSTGSGSKEIVLWPLCCFSKFGCYFIFQLNDDLAFIKVLVQVHKRTCALHECTIWLTKLWPVFISKSNAQLSLSCCGVSHCRHKLFFVLYLLQRISWYFF